MELATVFDGCRTYRRFIQKPLPDGLVTNLADVARKRSTGRNEQPLRFVTVEKPEHVEAMKPLLHWAAALPKEIGTPHPDEQPVAFVVVLKPAQDNSFITGINVGIALDAMAIVAWEKHVGSAILAAVDRAKIAALLHVTENLDVVAVLALGYPAMKSTLVKGEKGKSLDYYVDKNRDYYVPKLSLDETVSRQ